MIDNRLALCWLKPKQRKRIEELKKKRKNNARQNAAPMIDDVDQRQQQQRHQEEDDDIEELTPQQFQDEIHKKMEHAVLVLFKNDQEKYNSFLTKTITKSCLNQSYSSSPSSNLAATSPSSRCSSSSPFSTELLECPFCCEQIKGESMMCCESGHLEHTHDSHKFCKSCLDRLAEEYFSDDKFMNQGLSLPCPFPKCNGIFPFQIISTKKVETKIYNTIIDLKKSSAESLFPSTTTTSTSTSSSSSSSSFRPVVHSPFNALRMPILEEFDMNEIEILNKNGCEGKTLDEIAHYIIKFPARILQCPNPFCDCLYQSVSLCNAVTCSVCNIHFCAICQKCFDQPGRTAKQADEECHKHAAKRHCPDGVSAFTSEESFKREVSKRIREQQVAEYIFKQPSLENRLILKNKIAPFIHLSINQLTQDTLTLDIQNISWIVDSDRIRLGPGHPISSCYLLNPSNMNFKFANIKYIEDLASDDEFECPDEEIRNDTLLSAIVNHPHLDLGAEAVDEIPPLPPNDNQVQQQQNNQMEIDEDEEDDENLLEIQQIILQNPNN